MLHSANFLTFASQGQNGVASPLYLRCMQDMDMKMIMNEFEKIIRDNVIDDEQAKASNDYYPIPHSPEGGTL